MIDRLSPALHPSVRPIGFQSWRDLTFVHWRVPAEEIEPLLPRPLEVDTFDGSAWVGLVLFRMFGVRPWWFPRGCELAPFFETNVRTYVHLHGQGPGVLFLSLDASHRLAVWAARRLWSLNYVWAQMSLERHESHVHYRSQRPDGAHCRIAVELTNGSPLGSAQATHARPNSLEHFLIERYYLYVARKGKLMRGQVHHQPYPLEPVQMIDVDENLLAANSLRPSEPPCHVAFSPGVDTEVFGLIPAEVPALAASE